jgi:hypothetical protein
VPLLDTRSGNDGTMYSYKVRKAIREEGGKEIKILKG